MFGEVLKPISFTEQKPPTPANYLVQVILPIEIDTSGSWKDFQYDEYMAAWDGEKFLIEGDQEVTIWYQRMSEQDIEKIYIQNKVDFIMGITKWVMDHFVTTIDGNFFSLEKGDDKLYKNSDVSEAYFKAKKADYYAAKEKRNNLQKEKS